MVAVLAGCRMALVSTGWASSQLVSINRHRNKPSSLVLEAPFLVLRSVCSSLIEVINSFALASRRVRVGSGMSGDETTTAAVVAREGKGVVGLVSEPDRFRDYG